MIFVWVESRVLNEPHKLEIIWINPSGKEIKREKFDLRGWGARETFWSELQTGRQMMQGRWKGGRHLRKFIWNDSCYEVIDTVTFEEGMDTIPSIRCNIIYLPLPEQKIRRLDGNLLELPPLTMVSEHAWKKLNQPVFGPDGPLHVELPRR